MLPLLAPLLFALLGFGALVVDGGLAFSEQERLDTRAEMVAREWAHARSLPPSERPIACAAEAPGSAEESRCLRSALLAPLLEEDPAIEARGVSLGALDPQGVLDAAPDGAVRLRRSTPLLFGWASLPARAASGESIDFAAVQAARASEGRTPTLEGRGLRAKGFQLEGRAALGQGDSGSPALRVGPVIPAAPAAAGAVGLAWRLDALDRLAAAIVDPASPALVDLVEALVDPQQQVRLAGVVAGCLFDPGDRSVAVGEPLAPATPSPTALPLAMPRPLAVAYLPVVEACGSEVVGFVAVSIVGSPTGAVGEIALQPPSGFARHRNVSALPGSTARALAAERVLAQPAHAALLESGAPWAGLLVRVPRLRSAPSIEDPAAG